VDRPRTTRSRHREEEVRVEVHVVHAKEGDLVVELIAPTGWTLTV